MSLRVSLIVPGSFVFRKNMAADFAGLTPWLPRRRSTSRMAIETSPKSMSTGQGVSHLWQTVQWSATSPNSSQCWIEMPRRVCSSYRNASISIEVARTLLRGE